MNRNIDNSEYFMTDGHKEFAGQHFIIDFWGSDNIVDIEYLKNALIDAAKAAGATLLHVHLHEFNNGGVTGVALLAESHISVHTWPERDFAAFDVFMCGNAQPEEAVELLKRVFKPSEVSVSRLLRGERLRIKG